MHAFNFNELPEVIRQLYEKVEQIEMLVQNLQPREQVNSNDLLTITEAAQFLKTTVASLYTKVSRKEIPVSKPGKRLYFSRSELQEWIRAGRKMTASDIRGNTAPMQNRLSSRPIHRLDKFDR